MLEDLSDRHSGLDAMDFRNAHQPDDIAGQLIPEEFQRVNVIYKLIGIAHWLYGDDFNVGPYLPQHLDLIFPLKHVIIQPLDGD